MVSALGGGQSRETLQAELADVASEMEHTGPLVDELRERATRLLAGVRASNEAMAAREAEILSQLDAAREEVAALRAALGTDGALSPRSGRTSSSASFVTAGESGRRSSSASVGSTAGVSVAPAGGGAVSGTGTGTGGTGTGTGGTGRDRALSTADVFHDAQDEEGPASPGSAASSASSGAAVMGGRRRMDFVD